MAIKPIYAEFTDENGVITKLPVYKDPKTDREAGGGNFKKSQKGCCSVFWKDKWNKKITYVDGLTWEASMQNTLMETIFKDGKMVVDETLADIRDRLNDNKF